MKNIIYLLLLFLPSKVFGQYQYGLLKENFFGRQPSARAEAMGKSYTSMDGDLSSVYFNPAGISSMKGIELNSSYTPPSYYLTEGYYRFFAVGYNFNKYLQVAISQFHFDYGKTPFVGVQKTPFSEQNKLTIASEPFHNLFVGLNTTFLVWQIGQGNNAITKFFDLGVIKKFRFLQKENTGHSVNIGASILNLNSSTIELESNGSYSINVLPVTTRFGAHYQFYLHKHFLTNKLKTFRFLLQGEYQKLLNSDYESAFRGGGEITLLEILSIRSGYYKEKIFNYGNSTVNYNKVGGITYGLGIQIPLDRISKIPLNVNIDYTNLPQPLYSKIDHHFDNFSTYTLRLNWVLKDKKK